MYIFLSFIVIVMGLLMAIYPQGWFELTQRWKSYSAAEPSDLYITITRVSGIVCTLAGVAYIILEIVL